MSTQEVLYSIASCLGKPQKVDDNTYWATRGKFSRISVEIDFDKPVISRVMIDELILNVEYENFIAICFVSDRIGHITDTCHISMERKSKVGIIPIMLLMRRECNRGRMLLMWVQKKQGI